MTSATLPAHIVLSASVEGLPLGNAIFEVELPMTRKNDYEFPVGVAAADGTLTVSGAEIARLAKSINDLLLMDYVGLAAGWTGEIRVRAANRSAITRLRSAHSTWGHAGIYPPDFTEWLDRLESCLAPLHTSAVIAVTARSEPEGAVSLSTSEVAVGGEKSR
jgi:hypothetical protein